MNIIDLDQKMRLVMGGVGNDLVNAFGEQVAKDTGLLMRNISYQVIENEIVFTFPKHAVYLEYGTGLYNEYPGAVKKRITPKEKKALAFKWKGKQFILKSVAGMTPQPFIRPVMHQKLMEILIENLNRQFKEVKISL